MSIQTERKLPPAVDAHIPPARSGFVGRTASRFPALDSFEYADFRWLWLGSVASYLGMNMEWITRGWLVLRLADDSPLALAFVMVSFALPMTFMSLIGGALADRIPRKQMMIYSQLGNVCLMLILAILDFTGLIAFWHVLVLGFFNGSMMAFNMPSRQAVVSEIVPPNKLMNGISLVSSAMNSTRIIGPAVAGVLIVFIDTSGVFFLLSGVYALAALSVIPVKAGREAQAKSGKSMIGDIGAGLTYARHTPPLGGLIVMAFIPILFGMSYYALVPAWAREVLDVGSDNLGWLYMVMGIGALTGTLTLASLRDFNRRGPLLLGSCFVWGIVLATFSQLDSYLLIFPTLLFMGFVSSLFMSLNMTLMQMSASPEMRGRMMSIAMMSFGAMPLSAVPFAALAERIGTADSLLISGVMLAIFTAIFAVAYPAFRRIA